MDEEVVTRADVVDLLFIVNNIMLSLGRIERLLLGGDDGEEEGDPG